MKTKHIEFIVDTDPKHAEAVIAWLGSVGFHAFEETQKGVRAYIMADLFEKEKAMGALSFLGDELLGTAMTEIEPRNWNEEWEASWQNVEIADFCQIIPSFREPNKGFDHTVVVDPKMAFGTGHHATTRSVIQLMRQMEWKGKNVLDMGCGTGILGILALKMGAEKVFAIDIDAWSVENTLLNTQLNDVEPLLVIEGTVTDIPTESYDVIFANINKNVLLEDIPAYSQRLSVDGDLLLSGFYTQDEAELISLTELQGLQKRDRKEENNWVALSFCRKK